MNVLSKLASIFLPGTEKALETHDLTTHCDDCGAPGARIILTRRESGWTLGFWGFCGMNGGADPLSDERAQAILEAFQGPNFEVDKIAAAGFYDDAGYCRDCGKFYCETHWNVSSSGGGTCPAGHFKSLDPHWSPDF